MNKLPLLVFLFHSLLLSGQKPDFSINDKIVAAIPDHVQVVGLGDPTHQESTITQYRIDLIKKLVQAKNYSIIMLESNLLELYHAHQAFIKDGNIKHYEAAIYAQLNATEMEPLYELIKSENQKGNPLRFVGFDPVLSGNTFASTMEKCLAQQKLLTEAEVKDFIKQLHKASQVNIRSLFYNRKNIRAKITQYASTILAAFDPKEEADYFLVQSLNNLVYLYNDTTSESYDTRRDKSMASNVAFVQERFPNQKIILFGSSSHLLKNPNAIKDSYHQGAVTTMGNELHKTIDSAYYYIAYTALSGQKFKLYNKAKPLPELKVGSIEWQTVQKAHQKVNYLTPPADDANKITSSRFLGHHFVDLNIWQVMDMLVLLEQVEPFKIKKR